MFFVVGATSQSASHSVTQVLALIDPSEVVFKKLALISVECIGVYLLEAFSRRYFF